MLIAVNTLHARMARASIGVVYQVDWFVRSPLCMPCWAVRGIFLELLLDYIYVVPWRGIANQSRYKKIATRYIITDIPSPTNPSMSPHAAVLPLALKSAR